MKADKRVDMHGCPSGAGSRVLRRIWSPPATARANGHARSRSSERESGQRSRGTRCSSDELKPKLGEKTGAGDERLVVTR